MRGNNMPTASGTAQEGEVEHGPHTETSRTALCVCGERGGAGVLLPLLWDSIQISGPADPQQWILKWGQSSFNVTDVSGLGTQNVSFPSQAWDYLNHSWSECLNWTRFLSATGWTHRSPCHLTHMFGYYNTKTLQAKSFFKVNFEILGYLFSITYLLSD